MIKNITLNGVSVKFEFERKSVKNINMRIRADGGVYVSAPRSVPFATVETFLLSKADYILRSMTRIKTAAEKSVSEMEFNDGDSVVILGKSLTVKLSCGKCAVCLDDNSIFLSVKNTSDTAERTRVFYKWFNKLSREIILSYCAECYPRFEKRGVPYPIIRFRNMKSRWGVCNTRSKTLTFNVALLRTSPECIEYVVCHEFTHLLVPNHSAEFYSCLAMFFPDWKKARRALKNYTL